MLPPDTRAYLRRQIARGLGGPDGAGIRAVDHGRQSRQGEAAGQRPLSRRRAADHDAAAGPRRAAASCPRTWSTGSSAIGSILLDVHAQLVVDYMDAAHPELTVICLPMRRVRHQPGLALSVCLLSAWLLADAAATARPARRTGRDSRAAGAAAADAAQQARLAQVRRAWATSAPASASSTSSAEQMARVRAQFPFELMLTVGDNLYGGEQAEGLPRRSSRSPTRRCSTRGVKFYASLGNHDSRGSRALRAVQHGRPAPTTPSRRRSRTSGSSRSSRRYLDPQQLQWLRTRARQARATTGRFPTSTTRSTRRAGGTARICRKRKVLEPLFLKYGVSVVFAGHDHVYERVKPQQGIVHFVVGSSGQLRKGNIDKDTGFTDCGQRDGTGVSGRWRSTATRCTSTPCRAPGR